MSFRVIIAGGSLSGLILASSLEKAGIDYLLLEKGPVIAPQLGASFGLHAHGENILDQLGAWEKIHPLVTPLTIQRHIDNNDGKCFGYSKLGATIASTLGYPLAFLERRQLLEILYGTISDKSKVLTDKAVSSYTTYDDKITVHTTDGPSYDGDILVGADGIHSTVRRLMSHVIAKEKGETVDEKSDPIGERAFKSEYKCIFGICNRSETVIPLADGDAHTGYGQGASFTIAAGVPNYGFFLFYVKEEQQTSPPNVPRYTEDDCQNLIDEYRHKKVSENITVGDIWDARVTGVLVPLEEGVIDTWSHGRVVLVGDAVHKMTVNAGMGGNGAIEGATHLANLLHAAAATADSSSNLSSETVSRIFADYHQQHSPRLGTMAQVSAMITRLEGQATPTMRILSRYIAPLTPDSLKGWIYSKFVCGAPVLNFLPVNKDCGINAHR